MVYDSNLNASGYRLCDSQRVHLNQIELPLLEYNSTTRDGTWQTGVFKVYSHLLQEMHYVRIINTDKYLNSSIEHTAHSTSAGSGTLLPDSPIKSRHLEGEQEVFWENNVSCARSMVDHLPQYDDVIG